MDREMAQQRAAQLDAARDATATAARSPHWTAAARAELERILAAIRSVDEAKASAERIHRALAVYGLPDLPALPWKAPKWAPGAHGPAITTRRCDRCGREAPAPAFHMTAEGRICRKAGACALQTARERGAA